MTFSGEARSEGGKKVGGKRKEGRGKEEPPAEGRASSVACPCRPEQRAGVSAIVLPYVQTHRRPRRIATSVRASTQIGCSADTDCPQKLIAAIVCSADDAPARHSQQAGAISDPTTLGRRFPCMHSTDQPCPNRSRAGEPQSLGSSEKQREWTNGRKEEGGRGRGSVGEMGCGSVEWIDRRRRSNWRINPTHDSSLMTHPP